MTTIDTANDNTTTESVTGANAVSRNGRTLTELEDVIRADVAHGVDIGKALLYVELVEAGYLVDFLPRGRMRIALPDGTPISLTRLLRLSRRAALDEARCASCGAPTAYLHGLRGPRIDRRFCSNACRQRAYRQRGGAA